MAKSKGCAAFQPILPTFDEPSWLSEKLLAFGEAVVTLEGERNNNLMNFEMVTASIAHEARQSLAAIAINGSAALRFLERHHDARA